MDRLEITTAGLQLIKHFEGVKLEDYRDAVGVLTIGYGHTSRAGPPHVRPGMRITQAEAEDILRRDLEIFAEPLREELEGIPTTRAQFSAFLELAFNVGFGAVRNSTALRLHKAADYDGAAEALLKFVKARVDGELVVLPGLVRRRTASRLLYLSDLPDDGFGDEGIVGRVGFCPASPDAPEDIGAFLFGL